MRCYFLFFLFTITVINIPAATGFLEAAQKNSAELTGIKPTWVVPEMHVPAFFPATGQMISWSDGYITTVDMQSTVVQEMRKFNLQTGQKTVQVVTVQPRNLSVPPPEEFEPGDRWLSLASAADGSVYLTAEVREASRFSETFPLSRKGKFKRITQIILWDGKTLKPLDKKLYPNLEAYTYYSEYPTHVSIAPNGKHAAIWAQVLLPENKREYRICRFDLSSKKVEPKDRGVSFPERVSALKVLNDGSVLVSCNEQRIRDDSGSSEISRKRGYHLLTPEGRLEFLWNQEGFNERKWMAVSADSKIIALVEPKPHNWEDIVLFDVATHQQIGKIPGGPFEDPEFTFSPDGKHFAIGTEGDSRKSSYVLLYNLETKQMEKRLDISYVEVERYGKRTRIYGGSGALHFSPDSKWLNWQRVMGGGRSFYCVWSLE